MSELLPCPFCGGEAVFNTYRTTCSVDCPECRIGTYQVALDDYKAAIEAWNTRAEMSHEDIAILLDELGVPERTCENMQEHGFECSECGFFDAYADETRTKYCPNCGAKVVK